MKPDEWWIETSRKWIIRAYGSPVTDGDDFDTLLCNEIFQNGQTFSMLARKWNISLSVLGELIADHCRKLEE